MVDTEAKLPRTRSSLSSSKALLIPLQLEQWFSTCGPRPPVGPWNILEGSRVDILCTRLYYVCFVRVSDGGRWFIVGCCNGSPCKKGWTPLSLSLGPTLNTNARIMKLIRTFGVALYNRRIVCDSLTHLLLLKPGCRKWVTAPTWVSWLQKERLLVLLWSWLQIQCMVQSIIWHTSIVFFWITFKENYSAINKWMPWSYHSKGVFDLLLITQSPWNKSWTWSQAMSGVRELQIPTLRYCSSSVSQN